MVARHAGDVGNRSKWRGSRHDGPPSGVDDGPPGFGIPTSSPFTFEGGMERYRAFTSGVLRARGARRRIAYAMLFGPLLILLVFGIIQSIQGR